MDDIAISRFMAAVQGHPYEAIFLVTLFTGMRKGEILGLTWDHVDFGRGSLLVNQVRTLDCSDSLPALIPEPALSLSNPARLFTQ